MSFEISSLSPRWQEYPEPKECIQLQIFSEPCVPKNIVSKLAAIRGPVEVYCWYEGPRCLPKSGAKFMEESILKPLYQCKQDAKFYLYSLIAWGFRGNVTDMPSSTSLGDAINRINTAAIECMTSFSFLQYCTQFSKESTLYAFVNENLPKKKWLFDLSANQKKSGITVTALFNHQVSLFECIKDLDVSSAYSLMQYIEGYYLIQEAVKKGLSRGQRKIEIAFVLPNDESKYYLDLPKDIETMLRLDFGGELTGITIYISFHFFRYGDDLTSRPYIDKRRKAPKVEANEIGLYFDYLLQPPFFRERQNFPFLRDVVHNVNGWR